LNLNDHTTSSSDTGVSYNCCRPTIVDRCLTVADQGFVAQNALSTAIIPSKYFHTYDLLNFSNGNASELQQLLVLTSDAIMHAACTGIVNADSINYTINNRIFFCKKRKTLTNEYPNIQYIRFSTTKTLSTSCMTPIPQPPA